MKKIILVILFILAIAINSLAQATGPAKVIRFGTADPATCQPSGANIFYRTDTGILKVCTATNTWTAVGSSGTVTTVSVVSANGLAGTVANSTTTPAITLSTTITGILKGNGTAISAASAGSDYIATETDPIVKAINGLVKSNGSTIAAATAGSDYENPLTFNSPLARSTNAISCSTCGVTGNPLSQFASTTSAQLAGVLSDETGTLKVVLSDSPTFTTNITSPTILGVSQITGTTANMIITSGTGNSRTMQLQTTTSGGVATTFLTGNADQSTTIAGIATAPTFGTVSRTYTGGYTSNTNGYTVTNGVTDIEFLGIGGLQVISTDTIKFWSGTNLLSGAADITFRRIGAANPALAAVNSATPLPYILTVGESGSGTNIVGANGAIQPGDGTGTGGSGSVLIQVAPPIATGTTANTYATVATFASGSTTISTTTPPALASTTVGNAVAITATNATAGTTNNGAAAGGAVTITSGNAARLVSGNANGGNITLTPGTGIGTGTSGQVVASWNANAVQLLQITNPNAGAGALARLQITSDTTNAYLTVFSSGFSTVALQNVTSFAAGQQLNIISGADGVSKAMNLYTDGGTTAAVVVAATSGTVAIASTTDSTTTTSGALQVAGGAAIRKRVFIDGITASSGLQTAVLCQSSGGEMIADSVACLASSGRFKQNIKPLMSGLDEVMKLRPVSYNYKPEGIFTHNLNFQRERVGFIAEDIAKIDTRFVGYEADGITPRTVSYEMIVPLLVKSIQELKEEVDRLKASRSFKLPIRFPIIRIGI